MAPIAHSKVDERWNALLNVCHIWNFGTLYFTFSVSGSAGTVFWLQKLHQNGVPGQFYHCFYLMCTGGERDWKQVVCNGGVAAELAVISMVNVGCGEYAVDFRQHPTASWLVSAVLGALSCSCGDTLASEIGSAVGSWSPRLITNLHPVPKGLLLQQHFISLLLN